MFSRSNQSFEPRVGTAQLVFAVIYTLITLCILSLAFYVQSLGNEPYLHFFMAVLFAIMALKSFIIYKRIKKLIKEGVKTVAEVDSCEAVRGITTIKGSCEVKDFGFIYIESRLVGETVAMEIKRYMEEHKQTQLPALIVGQGTAHPRGMFTVCCDHGHLIEKTCLLTTEEAEATPAAPEAAEAENVLETPAEIIAEVKASLEKEEAEAKAAAAAAEQAAEATEAAAEPAPAEKATSENAVSDKK